MLWNNSDGNGAVDLWTSSGLTADLTVHHTYGPYPGWSARSLAAGYDSVPRILWNKTDGSAALWRVDSSGGITQTTYGPFPGWTARGLAIGSDNMPRIMWTNTDGTLSLWSVDAQGGYTFQNFGPYSGYTASLIAVDNNNVPRILWNKTDGSISLWNGVDGTAGYSHTEYGPYPGYAPLSLSADGSNAVRLLWNHPFDSTVSLWDVPVGGGVTFQNYTNPVGYSPAGTTANGYVGNVEVLYAQPDATSIVRYINPNGSIGQDYAVAAPGASTGTVASYGHYVVDSYSGVTMTIQDVYGTHTVNPTSNTQGYSGNADIYSGSNNFLSAKIQGPLTTTFRWIPDAGTNSPPPAQASVTENCNFSWALHYPNTGVGGSYDTDLGQSGSITEGLGGSGGGSKTFSVNTGGKSTFSVSCSPLASFSGPSGSGTTYHQLSFSFTAAAIVPSPATVEFNTLPLVGGIREAITGQKIIGSLNYTGSGTVGTISWNVDSAKGGSLVGGYTAAQGYSQFQPANTQGTTVNFYDAIDDVVTVTANTTVTLPDKTTSPLTASAQVTVVKPASSWGRSNTPQNNFASHPNDTQSLYGAHELWWPVRVTVQSPFSGGMACFVQIIQSTSRVDTRLTGNPYMVKVEQPDGSWILVPTPCLDTNFPYPYALRTNPDGSINDAVPSISQWDVANVGAGIDVPGVFCAPPLVPGDAGMNDWYSSQANDQFTTWLMYKPNYTDAIWVPLKKLSWSWQSSAQLNKKLTLPVWQLGAFTGDSGMNMSDAIDWPTWYRWINYNSTGEISMRP